MNVYRKSLKLKNVYGQNIVLLGQDIDRKTELNTINLKMQISRTRDGHTGFRADRE